MVKVKKSEIPLPTFTVTSNLAYSHKTYLCNVVHLCSLKKSIVPKPVEREKETNETRHFSSNWKKHIFQNFPFFVPSINLNAIRLKIFKQPQCSQSKLRRFKHYPTRDKNNPGLGASTQNAPITILLKPSNWICHNPEEQFYLFYIMPGQFLISDETINFHHTYVEFFVP